MRWISIPRAQKVKEDWQGLRDVLGDTSNENSKQVKLRTNWWPGPIIRNIFPDDSLSQALHILNYSSWFV
jgi:hypothetical protein